VISDSVETPEGESLFSDDVRSFLTPAPPNPPRYGTIATVNADGSPHQTLIWYEVRGDKIVVNSRVGRRWPTNLRRNPRATLRVYDRGDGVMVECQVVATIEGAQALADISAMAYRYDDPADVPAQIDEWRRQQRITFVLRPIRVTTAGDPT
jgi:predicted pyridoxine 5'-phosphate oxidase superfamily flavin-nucleotide-binding protein